MRKPWRKIALALALSISCFATTHYIYQATAPSHAILGDRKPIAFVFDLKNEVDRRPLKRTIWQEIQNGEPVYAGEALRSAEESSAEIRFVSGGRKLSLEAGSLIVLTQSKNEIALELLDGSVFVAQTDATSQVENETESTPLLTLKSESGKVDLSRATASLSKSSEAGPVDLQVLKGSAEILSETGGTKTLESGQFGSLSKTGPKIDSSNLKILSPSMDKPVFVAEQNPGTQKFSWEQGPPSASVELWLGTQRKNMKLEARLPAGQASESGQLISRLRPGKYFWKLVFLNSFERNDSPIYRLDVQALAAPPIVQPGKNEFISLENEGTPIRFQWSSPEGASEITVEFSNSPTFSKILFSEKFPASTGSIDRALPTGKYSWRVSAYYPNENQVISGAPQGFEVWVTPPKVISISFNPPPSVQFPHKPSLKLNWTATEDEDVKKWRVKVADNEAELNSPEALQFDVENKEMLVELPKAGRYIASIEALDKDSKVLSKTESKAFELSQIPLLPAPQFNPAAGILQASPSGELKLNWNPIAGAKSYTLTLKAENGREVATQNLKSNRTGITDLLPGTYQVEIFAMDEWGRKSEVTEARSVSVPEGSGLSAPKLKKVKVNR